MYRIHADWGVHGSTGVWRSVVTVGDRTVTDSAGIGPPSRRSLAWLALKAALRHVPRSAQIEIVTTTDPRVSIEDILAALLGDGASRCTVNGTRVVAPTPAVLVPA